jgi:phospholipid transport system transporter-binding protein
LTAPLPTGKPPPGGKLPSFGRTQSLNVRRKHTGTAHQDAAFEVQADGRSRVTGSLHFTTVSALLAEGDEAIAAGQAAVIDLAGVTVSDSAGLALLIEWLSVAKAAGSSLKYENLPVQLHQLARLSEVEELLVPVPTASQEATAQPVPPP